MDEDGIFSSPQNLFQTIPYSQFVTRDVRTKDGLYKEMIVPEGMIVFRGITGKCQQEKVSYGKWYGSIQTAGLYMKDRAPQAIQDLQQQQSSDQQQQRQKRKGNLCAVQLIKPCRLMVMTDPETKKLLVSRFAQYGNATLQSQVSYAFGIRNLSTDKRAMRRQSMKHIDRTIVKALCQLFPHMDGYIFIAKWSEYPLENFHDEIFLCHPEACVAPIGSKLEQKFLENFLHEYLSSSRRAYRIQQFSLMTNYFPKHENIQEKIIRYLNHHPNTGNPKRLFTLCFLYDIGIRFDQELKPVAFQKGWDKRTISSLFSYMLQHKLTNIYYDVDIGNFVEKYTKDIPDAINRLVTNPHDDPIEFMRVLYKLWFSTLQKTIFGTQLLLSWDRHLVPHVYYIPDMSKRDWYYYIAFHHMLSTDASYTHRWRQSYPLIHDILKTQKRFCKIPSQVVAQQQQLEQTLRQILPYTIPAKNLANNACSRR